MYAGSESSLKESSEGQIVNSVDTDEETPGKDAMDTEDEEPGRDAINIEEGPGWDTILIGEGPGGDAIIPEEGAWREFHYSQEMPYSQRKGQEGLPY